MKPENQCGRCQPRLKFDQGLHSLNLDNLSILWKCAALIERKLTFSAIQSDSDSVILLSLFMFQAQVTCAFCGGAWC